MKVSENTLIPKLFMASKLRGYRFFDIFKIIRFLTVTETARFTFKSRWYMQSEFQETSQFNTGHISDNPHSRFYGRTSAWIRANYQPASWTRWMFSRNQKYQLNLLTDWSNIIYMSCKTCRATSFLGSVMTSAVIIIF